jgi:hypothetical protein
LAQPLVSDGVPCTANGFSSCKIPQSEHPFSGFSQIVGPTLDLVLLLEPLHFAYDPPLMKGEIQSGFPLFDHYFSAYIDSEY